MFTVCRVESKNENAGDDAPIAKWASICPQLQHYYCSSRRSLTIDEIKAFHAHKSPLFLTVTVGDDSSDAIEALAGIPKLVALDLHVSADGRQDFYRSLPKLKQVALINWSGGELNETLLESFKAMDQIRTLRFQSGAKPTDQFLARLPELSRLESVSINESLTKRQSSLLHQSLMRMESLKEVHNLRTPTGDELRGLMKRSDLKRINIDSLGKDASSGQLADLIRVNRQLESVTLKNVELTSELAYSLATCPALNHLSLSVGDFDGGLFQKTQIFSMLNQLHLSIRGKVQNLTVLTRIPNLSSLQISLSTRNPDDWSFIANAPALQRIDIMDGYCDDRIVGWIDQCKSLRSFLGGQDTIMTDAGVEQLSKCEHLTSLSIGGFIGGNAVRGLAHLPHLSSLSISTDLISEGERTELSKSFANLTRFGMKDLYPTAGGIVVGADSIYRIRRVDMKRRMTTWYSIRNLGPI